MGHLYTEVHLLPVKGVPYSADGGQYDRFVLYESTIMPESVMLHY